MSTLNMSIFQSVTKSLPRKKKQHSEREINGLDYMDINEYTENISSHMQSFKLHDLTSNDTSNETDKSTHNNLDTPPVIKKRGKSATNPPLSDQSNSLTTCEAMDLSDPTKSKPATLKVVKRRKTYTKDDRRNVLYLYYDMGMSVREINYVTGMCTGSIQYRINKVKKKFPTRRRNQEITDESIEHMKELVAHNADINLKKEFRDSTSQ
ncbi:hypothetical protein BC941DRAFT_441227 [Chlamydoabsidia padenii]|nr:hypothetical protein BC941DRAFT_441227 [Chlamydoabsidia padenii]